MSRMIRSLRRDEGMTLVELIVAMAILSIVALVFSSVLASVQRTVVEEEVRSHLNDQARLALQTIDREVRSGNILYDPTTDGLGEDPFDAGATGFMFWVYAQAQHAPDDEPRCELWVIDLDNRLLHRSWEPAQPNQAAIDASATDWRIVAEGVANRAYGQPAFILDPTSEGRTLTITFLVNPDLTRPQATQQFDAAVTGRNTSYGYPTQVCATLPTMNLPIP